MKRNKVTTACMACRRKKKKCDGERPVCEPCREQGSECRWTNYSGRSAILTRNYISKLEEKVERLENDRSRLTSSKDDLPTSPSTIASTNHVFTSQNLDFEAQQSISPRISPTEYDINEHSNNSHSQTLQTVSRRPQSVSAAITTVLSGSRNTFGTASIGNFVSQVVGNGNTGYQASDLVQPFQPDPLTERARPEDTPEEVPGFEYELPSRDASDTLMDTYWKYIHTIFPFVDRNDVEASYQNLWTVTAINEDDTIFRYILNIMFALAVRISPSTEPSLRDVMAKTFVTRAQEVHAVDIWNAGDFQSVQAMLLLCLHFHTADPHQSWIAISMAIRIAQTLGLHRSETSEQLPSIRAKELARRVWYGCVVLDCIVSQTYGRPSMLNRESAATIPLPAQLDSLSLNSSSSSLAGAEMNAPSAMDAFVQSIEMYEILAKILSQFYTDRNHNSRGGGAGYQHLLASPLGNTVLSFEQCLTEWFEKLPAHLRAPSAAAWGQPFLRQAVILQQRYLQVRILLLRPVLRIVVAGQNPSMQQATAFSSNKFRWELMLQCAVSCVETAQESINTIRTYGPSDIREVGNVSTWMHNILYLYAAATVLIAARLCPAILACMAQTSINSSWEQVISLLKGYEPFGSTPKRVAGILESLNASVFERYVLVTPKASFPDRDNIPDALTNKVNLGISAEGEIATAFSDELNAQYNIPDFFDLSAFELDDFSWMANIPIKI